ncbi:hypothetical protein TNIN_473911 [Trichonephila inaurata madagascariensis]|uniref:Uncharacterized protein n=1 Tax=Trichonephila inaurata madagascariensis TaxID=2747483 RepID=A0A8X6MHZ2_9ARAC|nr:hypothetical protein TNIN_473911 [Trichonephila inaurata madagascariensis]
MKCAADDASSGADETRPLLTAPHTLPLHIAEVDMPGWLTRVTSDLALSGGVWSQASQAAGEEQNLRGIALSSSYNDNVYYGRGGQHVNREAN